jgi:2-keto-4-pentenoate hydratase/2-oxohepta-3-ene-1,7-dioic acid hydratase in catechol pathway
MRFIRFSVGGARAQLGMTDGERVFELAPEFGASVEALFGVGPDKATDAGRLAAQGASRPISEVSILAPLVAPSKIICVGQNYPEHNQETAFVPPDEPPIFSKFASSIIGPGQDVQLPAVAPRRVDYEAELAVVIGRPGRLISAADAMDYVGGYTVANDISARDWQVRKPAGQWLLGKSFDTFLPLGPWIVTPDEIANPQELQVTCRVSGELLQDDSTASMIFSIPSLIAYVSQVFTLSPGDLILTGTPGGVGMSRKPPRWLVEGDVVETRVEGVGTLVNPIRSAGQAG